MVAVGLVLSAGGIVGAAWHSGAMAALAEATGFNPDSADLIVGTSAGAMVGAVLRAGIDPKDHLALETGRPLSEDAIELLAGVDDLENFPAPDIGLRPLGPRSIPLLTKSVTNWPPRPFMAATAALRSGRVSVEGLRKRANQLCGSEWPDAPLWLVCVRVRDGQRVVLGRDAMTDDVGLAVSASSAVPGYFEPVRIDGRSHVDGGVHSCSNADLVTEFDQPLDLVIVSSPRTITDPGWTSLPNRRFHRSMLESELERVRATGAATMILEPTPLDIGVLGERGMNPRRTAAAADRAHLSISSQFAAGRFDDVAHLLA